MCLHTAPIQPPSHHSAENVSILISQKINYGLKTAVLTVVLVAKFVFRERSGSGRVHIQLKIL